MRFNSFGFAAIVATAYAVPTAVSDASASALVARQAPGFPGAGGPGAGGPGAGGPGAGGPGAGGFPGAGGPGAGGRPGAGGPGAGGPGAGGPQGAGGPPGIGGQGRPGQGPQQGGIGQFPGQGGIGQGQGLNQGNGRRPFRGGNRQFYSVGPNFRRVFGNINGYFVNMGNVCYQINSGFMTQGQVIISVQDDVADIIMEINDLVTDLTAVNAGNMDATDVDTTELLNLFMNLFNDLDRTTNNIFQCSNLGMRDLLDDLLAALLSAILNLTSTASGAVGNGPGNGVDNNSLLAQIAALLNDAVDDITGNVDTLLGALTEIINNLADTVDGLTGTIGTIGTIGTVDDTLPGLIDIDDLADVTALNAVVDAPGLLSSLTGLFRRGATKA